MKKLFCSLLIIGCLGLIPIVNHVFAGEKANVVVTDSAGKELVIKSLTITSGSSTVASGLGTATHALRLLTTTNSGSATAGRYVISGANVTFYEYDPVTGGTKTTDYTGSAFIWGTP